MLLTDITKIIRVLLAAFETVASRDDLTQRRIGQIGQVIGAVEDVAETEGATDLNVSAKRVEQAHDIVHRIAAILAMEDCRDENDGNDGNGTGDDKLAEIPWNGKFEGETIRLQEDD